MGKKDISLKSYLSDKRRFADLFNGTLMGGSQVIDSDRLEDAPTVMSVSDESGIVERISYISMRYTYDGSSLALITVENQEYIDYAMPLRVMFQQSMAYGRQIKEIKSRNKGGEWQSGDEYLSKLKRTDRILPVIILVAYWGEKEWQGAKSIHDMLSFNTHTKELRKFVPEYKINFVDIKKYKDSGNFKTELRTFSGLYYCRGSKRKMSQYITSHKECGLLDSATFWTIANMTDGNNLKGLEKYKKKEEVNMCKAFEENWLDGVEKGTFKTLSSLVKDGLIEAKEAAKRMNITEEAFIERMQNTVC